MRKMLSMAMWMALIVAPIQAVIGDAHGLNTLKYQPAKIAAIEGRAAPAWNVLPFGDPGIDGSLPGGGLPLGRWHEAVGEGLEIETAAAAGAFVAALAAPLAAKGEVVWVMRRDDLHAPGLAGLGFPAQRLIQVKAPGEAQVLAALEDVLGSAGVAAAIGEVDGVDLIDMGVHRLRDLSGLPRVLRTRAGQTVAVRGALRPLDETNPRQSVTP